MLLGNKLDNWNGIGSLFIACVEFVLLLNILFFAERNKVNLLAAVLVLILMNYQILEFIICYADAGLPFTAYVAFANISFLPPLGLLIVLRFWNYNSRYWLLLFVPAIFFTIYYYLSVDQFYVGKCTPFYASYNYPLGFLYGLFYYTPVLTTVVLLSVKVEMNNGNKKLLNGVLLGGYVLISIPVAASFVFAWLGKPGLQLVIESVMCKSAVVLAFCYLYFSLQNKKEKVI